MSAAPEYALAFGTKAETLAALQGVLSEARLLPQLSFDVGRWRRAPHEVVRGLEAHDWATLPLIVRSSAQSEDSLDESCAGAYLSVPNVRGRTAFRRAVEEVIASYGTGSHADQLLVQPMLRDVELSGVAFTVDPNTGGPYRVINYDDRTGRTDTVTSGTGEQLKTYYHCAAGRRTPPPELAQLVAALDELEALFGPTPLDVEFCVAAGEVYVLQVRPLVAAEQCALDVDELRLALARLEQNIAERQQSQYGLCGPRTVFGVMPDWNPAEIIGPRPRPLAMSLYRELVTDAIWAYQRDNYGYRNLRSHPLMVSFHGVPYIDVRVSVNSFIPKSLPEGLAQRLADHYIAALIASPDQHDKLEFEVLFTCYTLDLPARLEALSGFDDADRDTLAESLRDLTNDIIHSKQGFWRQDLAKIDLLEVKQRALRNQSLPTVSRLYWMIEDCKRYGTLPFAGLARAGFVAVQLLQSLQNVGVISEAERASFMGSIDTVSGRMARQLGELDRAPFLECYGHLRPGTYDILSPRYDEAPDRYFDWSRAKAPDAAACDEMTLSLGQYRRTEQLLREHGLGDDVLGLFEFIKGAIEGREHAKFVFTRSLSEALSLLAQLGAEHGFSREDMSFADTRVIKELYTSCDDIEATLANSIELGRRRYRVARSLCLPALVVDPEDVWGFHLPSTSPNYVTSKKAQGPVVLDMAHRDSLRDAIVMIPSADPGYDWLFTCGIAGFITMYGGVNSHMAIRAAELGIPAVIGAGERHFSSWSRAAVLHLDCENRSVLEMCA